MKSKLSKPMSFIFSCFVSSFSLMSVLQGLFLREKIMFLLIMFLEKKNWTGWLCVFARRKILFKDVGDGGWVKGSIRCPVQKQKEIRERKTPWIKICRRRPKVYIQLKKKEKVTEKYGNFYQSQPASHPSKNCFSQGAKLVRTVSDDMMESMWLVKCVKGCIGSSFAIHVSHKLILTILFFGVFCVGLDPNILTKLKQSSLTETSRNAAKLIKKSWRI